MPSEAKQERRWRRYDGMTAEERIQAERPKGVGWSEVPPPSPVIEVTMRDAEALNALRLELPSKVWEDACKPLRDRIGAAVAAASREDA